MAVNPKVRGCGLGNLLVNELKKYCDETGVLQVTLSTANPRAGNFYKKNGFVDLAPADSKVLRMIMYLGERVIRRVAIVGGTHGNERIGIELIRQWAADKTALERSTFKTSVVIGNPLATKANVRYCDVDMNRQFSKKDVADRAELSKSILPSASSVSEEVSQAVSINELLGPKGAINEQYGCDFIIDLHSSNSNVGLVGMINGADKDCHALRLSQYLLKERQEDFPLLKITNSKFDKSDSNNVDSISPFGIAFEVGPIVHGTLSVELLDKTRELVYASLDFIEAQNLKLLQAAAAASTATSSAASASSEGSDPGVVRSQGRDIVLASSPATTQLIQKMPPFTEIDCYVEVSKMKYPEKDSAAANAEESLYPTLSAVHPSLEGADWTVIEEDQPAFMATDGTKKIFPFVRPVIQGGHFQAPGPPEAPPPLFLLFVNEAAYQQSGVAFAVYKKMSKTVF
jgi:succinylglutamate desuccinylase